MIPIEPIDGTVEAWVRSHGAVVREWRAQDSGCVALGVRRTDGEWFVKYATTKQGRAGLESAHRFHSTVRHSAIVAPVRGLAASQELALEYAWVDGAVLYDPVLAPGAPGRDAVGSPHRRFRSLPPVRIHAALDTIIDAHRAVADAGYVAVDLYDGCVLYDFDRHLVHLVDLDEYRPGPFRVEARLPGSSRFMAPEEWEAGSVVDERTTVFNLGRMIEEIGGDAMTSLASAVIERATQPDPAQRYESVARLATAWSAIAS